MGCFSVLLIVQVIHHIADGLEITDDTIRDFNVKLIFENADEIDQVKRIHAEVSQQNGIPADGNAVIAGLFMNNFSEFTPRLIRRSAMSLHTIMQTSLKRSSFRPFRSTDCAIPRPH